MTNKTKQKNQKKKKKNTHIFSIEISAHVLSRNSMYFPFQTCSVRLDQLKKLTYFTIQYVFATIYGTHYTF